MSYAHVNLTVFCSWGGSGNEIGFIFTSKFYDGRKNSVRLTTDILQKFQNLFGLESEDL
jgi:hypothetical protein